MAQRLNLDLGLAPHDPWVIKKKLSDSDVFFLMLPNQEFETSVIPQMYGQVSVQDMMNGVEVKVHIVEEGHDAHDHIVKLLLYNGVYTLTEGWSALVRAKGYKQGDIIGLMWDNGSARFFIHHI